MSAAKSTLTPESVAADVVELLKRPEVRLSCNALTRADAVEVLPKREVASAYTHAYSVKTKEYTATNQKASGRCWCFAGLNLARGTVIEKYNLDNSFEFSQSWTLFWDKLERAALFLDQVTELAKEPLDGRLMQHLLKAPLEDGGQWDMFVNVVNKYGLVPKSVFPESFSSSNTRRMRWLLTTKLRGWASELRTAPESEWAAMKAIYMKEFLGALVVSLGPPPASFDWSFMDKDGKHHLFEGLTPRTFVAEHLNANGFDFNDWISLINDPRNEYNKVYTVAWLNNVVGAPPIRYINVPIDGLKQATMLHLDEGCPVWFGCDVGKHFHRKMAVMDTALFDYELVYGTKPSMDKKTRLEYNDSLMTHAMLFTGYDRAPGGGGVGGGGGSSGTPSKWRVENSWGTGQAPNTGDPFALADGKGYYLMTDQWFDEYMYQVVVKKSALPEDLIGLVTTDEVTVLPAWDPMGALASVHGEPAEDCL